MKSAKKAAKAVKKEKAETESKEKKKEEKKEEKKPEKKFVVESARISAPTSKFLIYSKHSVQVSDN